MKRITAEDILVLHAMVLDETGGSHGVRDPHLLASIAEKPYGQFGGADLYPTLTHKAAVLFEALVNYHVFVDGNKRTGLTTTARFLYLGGMRFTAPHKALEEVTIAIATKVRSIDDLTVWIEANSEPL